MLLISFWTTKFCSSRLKFWWGWGRRCRDQPRWQAKRESRQGGAEWAGTHVGLGPVDEDLAHHPEQFLGAGIGLGQPVCPGWARRGPVRDGGSDPQERMPHRELAGEGTIRWEGWSFLRSSGHSDDLKILTIPLKKGFFFLSLPFLWKHNIKCQLDGPAQSKHTCITTTIQSRNRTFPEPRSIFVPLPAALLSLPLGDPHPEHELFLSVLEGYRNRQ